MPIHLKLHFIMRHIPVLLRRAAKYSAILILLGIAEYVIVAHIHTQLGDRHTKREAAIIAQRLAQGHYDNERDPQFHVVGYSWQMKERKDGKNKEEKDRAARMGRDAGNVRIYSKESEPANQQDIHRRLDTPIVNEPFIQPVLTKSKVPEQKQAGKFVPSLKSEQHIPQKLITNLTKSERQKTRADLSVEDSKPHLVVVQSSKKRINRTVTPTANGKQERVQEQAVVERDNEAQRMVHKNQDTQTERESDEEYLNRLLLSYIIEGKRRKAAGAGRQDADQNGGRSQFTVDYEDFQIIQTNGGLKIVDKRLVPDPEVLVENGTRPYRHLSPSERKGVNIMFTLRTTTSYHRDRLPLLIETWMTKVDASHIFLVTDGPDPTMEEKARAMGMHYELAKCGKSHFRDELCCKAGEELKLLFRPENGHHDWLCHIDDDMYVNLNPLIKLLSKFDPKTDPVYLGRAGSGWREPRKVKSGALLGKAGQRYHFAVGGMYCLSRALLMKARPYLVGGKNFASSCLKTLEPEDVTVGFIVGIVLNHTLSRTELINTHGIHLATYVDPSTLRDQVAVSYGFGSEKWGYEDYNAVYVPDALFDIDEDESQFRSLHCHLYPETQWCVKKQLQLEQMYRRQDYRYHRDS